MRICLVTTFYPPFNFGGDGIAVQRLARALARLGHQVTIVHDVDAFNALHHGPEPEADAEPEGIVVLPLRSGLGPVAPLTTHLTGRPLARGSVRRLLDEGAFDVVHFHNISLVGGPGILSAGEGVKLYTAHEHWLVCPTHVLWRHQREPCPGRQCLRCTLRYRRPPQIWRYTGYLDRQLRHVDTFIALSEFSRRKHHEFGFSRPMEVVPLSLPDDAASADGRPHQPPYFLFVGRLERLKGLDEVIPLFREYTGADLLIAGHGGEADALARQAEADPRIRFLGQVAPEELRRYYRHAVALIVPSRGYEAFPTTIIEAFREGTPVIARRRGPFPEIVEPAGGGRLFDSGDELLAAMRSLRSDDDLRRRLGKAARAAFVENWSDDAVMPRYLQLVERSSASDPLGGA